MIAATAEPATSPERPVGRLRKLGRAFLIVLPTRRAALLVLLLAPVWLLAHAPAGRDAIAVVVLLLVALFAGDALTLPAGWQLTVEREFPEQAGIRDAVPAAYVVRNAARRPLRVRVFDRLPRGVSDDRRQEREVVVRAAGALAIPITLTGRERGRWFLGPVVLRVASRLGLVQRTVRRESDGSILVTPSMSGVRRYRLLSLHHRLRDAGVRAVRRRGEGMSFSNLREYVQGDDPRRIDWKATARRHKLITREYTHEQGQTVLIAIDAGRMMTQLAAGLPRFEYALSSATLLADVAVQSGDQVGLLLFDDQVRAFVPPARGREALERIRRALVPAAASLTEPDYAAAFRVLAERHRRRSLIVLLTDVIGVRASHSLIGLTTRGAARHLLLVVALRNEQLVSAAVPGPDANTAHLYESAAAEEMVQSREAALARMRRAGVAVLDVPPQAMTAAVINRYLEIKARSSL